MNSGAQQAFKPKMAFLGGVASLVTVIVLIVIKGVAYLHGDSTSVLASLTDSLTDAGASLISMFAIHMSLKPADRNHRYGHGKFEGLAALSQSAFIGAAAIFLAVTAAEQFGTAHIVSDFDTGIVVMVLSVVLSVVLVQVQNYSLRFAPSLAVESDKAHYGADIVVNLGVIVSLFLQKAGAPDWVDPLFAILVALWLLRIAYKVACGGLDMLLDREMPTETREKIKAIINADPRVLGVHDLRTRLAGMAMHVSFDIEVDSHLELIAAHNIARDVEAALLKEFPNAEIMIHVDPAGETDDARHNRLAH